MIPYEQKGSGYFINRNNNSDIFIVSKVPNYKKVVYNDINKRKHYALLWSESNIYFD